MAVVMNASHFLLDARLADDCSDYYCNHSSPHKPSDPSHQILMTRNGGASFQPLYEVHGRSPWGPDSEARPFLGPCSLQINSTTWLAHYQGQIRAPWRAPVSLFSLDDDGLRHGLAERTAQYEGIDEVCGTGHMWNQGVITTDGGWIMSAQCDSSSKKAISALIFNSTDGFVWRLMSTVPVVAGPGAAPCESAGENTVVEMVDGNLLLVARCGGGSPLLAWSSATRGLSWERHVLPDAMRGVMPVAVRMDSGAIVLATGRGGLAAWLNPKGDGKEWLLTNIGARHNELVMANKKLRGSALQYTEAFCAFNATRETTAYNTLRKLGPDSGVLCYDRLSSSTTPGSKDNPSWRGPPGNRDAEDHIFCMRFRLKLDDEDTRRRKRT